MIRTVFTWCWILPTVLMGQGIKNDFVTKEEPWYKTSIIYNLDIEVFKDSDGDGTGDIKGLISKLDYIDSLGTDVIWLAPFQPTPNRDDGYDVSDYYGIDKRLGNWDDFQKLITEVHHRKLKVIMDLVINHSSDEHPWFVASRDSNSSYRNWYSWSVSRPKDYDKGMGFPGVEKHTWDYDSIAHAYYYHRFYSFQPDLNAANPAVQAEVAKMIRFWMFKGVDGFRIDAVPFFIEVPNNKGKKFGQIPEILNPLRQILDSIRPGSLFLGEINVLPKDDHIYFGDEGERMNVILNFFVNQHIFLSLATGNAKRLKKALKATAVEPPGTAWGQFLRNHDEVDLGRLSHHQRLKVYRKFGKDPSMHLYHRGIRRRMAPMMQNTKLLLFANSLLFSLPSMPVVRYGEELAMGDNLTLHERLSVRTPMQWTPSRMAGFTTANSSVRPVIDTGAYSCKRVNVQNELQDPLSLLNWTRELIRLRRSLPEIAMGTWQILPSHRHTLVLLYSWKGRQVLVAHNFCKHSHSFEMEGFLTPVNDHTSMPKYHYMHSLINLEGHDSQWFIVGK